LAVVGCLCIPAQAGWAAACSYLLNLPVGFSLIANQCDHVGGNTLNAVFPTVPGGSQILKLNCQTQSYEPTATFNNGAWTPNLTLDPGEGAYFINPGPAMTVTISGDAHTPVLPLNVPVNGCCLVSLQEPLAGGVDEIIGLGGGEGDNVFRFNPLTSRWNVYNYSEDNPGWSPSEPVANVGESFWYCRAGAVPPPPPSCDPVRILQQPTGVEICCTNATNCATFNVTATGTAPLSYQWFVNNAIIAGATASSYSLCPVSLADDGNQYTVKITNSCGSVTSQVATLKVSLATNGPTVTCPADLTVQCDADVPVPNPASVRATDNCDPVPVVMHVSDTASGTCPKTITRTYKATDACGNVGMCSQTITVADTTPPTITCTGPATMECAVRTTTFNLVPGFNSITNPYDNGSGNKISDLIPNAPENTQVCKFNPTRCNPFSADNPGWSDPNMTLNPGETVTVLVDPAFAPAGFTITFIENSGTPTFPAPTVSDACDPSPTVTFVDVRIAGACPQAYSLTRTWTATDHCGNQASCSQTITVQDTLAPVLSCPVDVTVQRDADMPAPNPVAVSTTDCDPGPVVMHVSDVVSSTCPRTVLRTYKATDACGNVGMCTQVITVRDTVIIISQPANATVAACSNTNVTFAVTATGNGTLGYQWLFNGQLIPDATNASYEIASASQTNAGNYSVRIVDSCSGLTSATALLTVGPSVVISSQPADTTVMEGTSATFSVVATSGCDPIIFYQWFRNRELVPGATNASYTTGTSERCDNGDLYQVKVSDSGTTIFSRIARLTVTSLQACTNERTVLILSTTVTGGANSLEAQAAASLGYEVEIATPDDWAAKSAADFARYRAIILGDPNCGSSGAITAAVANNSVWAPVIDGNVILIGTDPEVHQSLGGAALIDHGVRFAVAQTDKTGLYVTLSCYYAGTAPQTPVPLLEHLSEFGSFTVTGVGFYNDAHIVASHPALNSPPALADSNLSNWSCSVHEAFDSWPADFLVLAIARGSGASFTATDGSVGTPYILVRGEELTVVSDIALAPDEATNVVNTAHMVVATVRTNGTPAANVTVTFRVVAGPNAGRTGSNLTDAAGQATFTYTGGASTGTDFIEAQFVDRRGLTQTSNRAKKVWVGCSVSLVCPENIITNSSAGQCQQIVTFSARASDNCDTNPAVTCTPASGFFFAVGTTTVICSATDSSGNTNSCAFSVTLNDNQLPGISCPANIVASADPGQCSKSNVTYTATASDNCTNVSLLCVPPSGSTFPMGTTNVTCTVTDAAGNTNSCTFTVTVQDKERPAITCLGDLVVCADPGQTSKSNLTYVLTATDSCLGVNVGCDPPSGSTFPLGATPVHCVATDTAGNSNSCSFTVAVNANTAVVPLSNLTRCRGDAASYTAVTPGTAALSYRWTLDDSPIGSDSPLLVVATSGLTDGNHTVQMICTGACGAATNRAALTVQTCARGGPCSFTQGFYGNANGKFNGTRSLTLISNLLSTAPLVVGKTGVRSLTIPQSAVPLLQTRMPAGGTPATLPNSGDQNLLTAVLPLYKATKFAGILLGQTITLSLNVRLDPSLLAV